MKKILLFLLLLCSLVGLSACRYPSVGPDVKPDEEYVNIKTMSAVKAEAVETYRMYSPRRSRNMGLLYFDLETNDGGIFDTHTHEFIDGVCECGATDPNYEAPHEHVFVEGKCECGATDPN